MAAWDDPPLDDSAALAAAALKLPPASHTFHTAWKQCPRKAWHGYIARDIERVGTDALLWGIRVHAALEKHLSSGEPLPDELKHHAHLYEFPPDGYKVYAEVKLGITRDGVPCDFFAERVFARGVIDVLVLSEHRPDIAMIIDHKTGKVREDPAELEVHAVLLKAAYDALRSIKGWYNWLSVNSMGPVHDLSDTETTFARMLSTHDKIARAFVLGAEAFPPRQGPLCGWCGVKTCEFHPNK